MSARFSPASRAAGNAMMRWFAGFVVVAVLGARPLQAKEDPVILTPNERLLVLPLEFSSYKVGLGTFEMATDKTELGRRNLVSSLHRALQRERALQFVELPELSVEETATVREHTDLLQAMGASAVYGLIHKTVPWRDKRAWRVDYGIGAGLAFLAERAGVDKALFVSGMRVEPTTELALGIGVNLLFGALPSNAVNLRMFSAIVVDLRSGDVIAVYSPVRGLEGEPQDVAGANTWVRALFDDIPGRVRSEPPVNQPPARKHERHVRSLAGFAIMPPKGWRVSIEGASCFRRHDGLLEKISVDRTSLESLDDPMKLGAVAMDLLKADPVYKDMEVVSLAGARVGGRDGFRAELKSQLGIADSPRRERHLVYGVAGPRGVYLLRFDAPAIYYYEHHVAEFEAAVSTFELL